MESENRHWVEDLFPPTYALTLEEIIGQKTHVGVSDAGGDDRKNEPSVFEKLTKNISPLDTKAIKNVYERVWFIQNLESLEREKSAAGVNVMSDEGSARDKSTSTSDLDDTDPCKSCVWTDGEIDILRTLFRTAQHKSHELEAKLKAVTSEINLLKQKTKVLSKSLEDKSADYAKAASANKRLAISVDFLKKEQCKAEEIISCQSKALKELQEKNRKKKKDILKLEKGVDRLNINNKTLENELVLHQQEVLREQILREENLKQTHEKTVSDAMEESAKLRQQLEKERQDHAKTRKGLDHLRTHFASLPQLESDVSNKQSGDLLTKWTYY